MWNGDVVYWLEAVGSQRLYINTNSDLKEFHKRVERIKLEIYVLFHRYWYVILILVYELYALVISILLILDSGMILNTYSRLWIACSCDIIIPNSWSGVIFNTYSRLWIACFGDINYLDKEWYWVLTIVYELYFHVISIFLISDQE